MENLQHDYILTWTAYEPLILCLSCNEWSCGTYYQNCWKEWNALIRQWCYRLGQKKNCYVALIRPKFENWVGRSIFYFLFFIFLRTVRELSFPIFFLQFLNGENSGGMQSKRIYKCFFRPLNTNFSKFFAQIWHFQHKKKKKKTDPVFRILRSVGRGQHNHKKIWPYGALTYSSLTWYKKSNTVCGVLTYAPAPWWLIAPGAGGSWSPAG